MFVSAGIPDLPSPVSGVQQGNQSAEKHKEDGVVTSASSSASGWMFRADLTHSGVYDDGGIRPNNESLWNYTTGYDVLSSPVVVNGVVYVGSWDHKVYAFNATTGAKIWEYTTGSVVESSPAVANGVVYVGSGDKKVYAFNATTGAKIWEFATGYAVLSSPAVATGVVYVGNDGGKVYALDAETGTNIWEYTTGREVYSSPAVANGVVYVGNDGGKVYAFNATTGVKIWEYTTGNLVRSSPAVTKGVVYVGSYDHNIYALNAETGVKIWEYKTGSSVGSSPAVANGVVYVGNKGGKVYAFNAETGTKIWEYTTGYDVLSSPSVANGIVYVGSCDNKIYALDATTGADIWNYTTRDWVYSSPAVSNGVVYVGSQDKKVYAIGAPSTHPTITTITPPSAPNTVPVRATITGTGFFKTGATISLTNGSLNIPGTPSLVNKTTIVCTFPLTGAPTQNYTLTVRNPDGQSASLANAFTVMNATPVITSINPSSAFNASIIPVTITGSGFRSGATISLMNGSMVLAGTITNRTTNRILCTFPLGETTAGIYNLSILNIDGSSVTKLNGFTVTAAGTSPTIDNFTPVSGVNNGIVPITINGTNFRSGATVRIANGSVSKTVTISNGTDTQVRCTLPLTGLPYGLYNLTVRNPDGSNTTAADSLTVMNPDPVITKVVPGTAYNTTSCQVRITGTNFTTGCSVTLTNGSTEIPGTVSLFTTTRFNGTFDLNGSPVGIYTLTVSNPGNANGTKLNCFTVVAPPSVPAISTCSPATGENTAAMPVTINGTNFRAGITVTITNGTTMKTVSGTVKGDQIRCTLPSKGLPCGIYNLTVRNTDGSSATKSDAFIITNPAPIVTGITPATGYNTTPVTLTVTGSKFVADCSAILVNGSTEIPGIVSGFTATKFTATFVLPGNPAGIYTLTVTNPGGSNTTKKSCFTVSSAGNVPTIGTINPGTGLNTGTVSLVVNGTNFRTGATVTVTNQSATKTVTASSVTDLQLKCSMSLTVLPYGLYNLTVRNKDGSNVTKSNAFLVTVPAPTVTKITPEVGNNTGTVTVTITGTKFATGAGIVLTNKSTTVTGSVASLSEKGITGSLPLSGVIAGVYNLTVTNPGGPNTTKANAFIVLAGGTAPVISSIDPGSGFNNANMPVVIRGVNFRSPTVFLSQGSLLKQAPATVGKVSGTSTLYVTLPLTEVPGGLFNITVRNSDGVFVYGTDIFYVTDRAWISKRPQTGTRSSMVQNPMIPIETKDESGSARPLERPIVWGR